MNIPDYALNVQHGGFKSFLLKAIELGVTIELLEKKRSVIIKLSHENTVFFCAKRYLPILCRMGNLTKDKVVTKTVLRSVGIDTPQGIIAISRDQAVAEIREKKLRYPLIVKPLDGSLARGVTWNVTSEDEVALAVSHALTAYGDRKGISIMVEEMFVGDEYRVLIYKGRIASCIKKVPAGITGDGVSTIQTLIKNFNRQRRHGFEIKLDTIAKKTLSDAGFTLKTVLLKDVFFKLRNNLNMSDGGRSIECTEKMSPALQKICIQAVDAVGLTYGGIDLLTNQLSSKNPAYVILEVNPNPYYNMHEKPLVEGVGIDFSKIVLEDLFPSLRVAS
jgi:cyanophycin synthetase